MMDVAIGSSFSADIWAAIVVAATSVLFLTINEHKRS